MAIKTLRVFQEFTSAGYIPMPVAGNIDYGVTIAGTFPGTTPTTFQTDDPDIDVTLTATTDYYVWIRSHGTDWNPMYTRNVRVYPDSPLINNVVMGIIIANLSNTVPYTGATANVNLGEYGLTAGYLGLDLTPTGTPTTAGNIYWDAADGTLNVNLLNSVVTHLGGDLPVLVKSDSNSGLVKGSVVYQKGSDGANTTVLLAQANTEATSSKTFGIIANTTSGGAKAYCITFGYVRGIDTLALTEGATVYLSPTVAGGFTSTKPQAPNHIVTVGRCIRSHATQGVIFVTIQNGFELDELHDVQITSVANKNTLVYDSATTLWKNRNIFGTQGYIPYYDDTLLMKDSIIYTNGTNVGIGSTTLTEKLVVNGNILATQFKKVGGLSTEFLKADGSSDPTKYQPWSADLTAIDDLALTTGLLRKNGTDTWVLDQTEYLALATAISTYQRIDNLQSNLTASATKYPSVNAVNTGLALKLNLTGGTLTGALTLNYSYPNIALSDVSSGTTWNIINDGGAFKLNYGATNKFYIFSNGNAEFINNLTASSLIKAGGTSTQFLKADGSVDSTTYQPYDADLSAIGALALTTGLLRKNGANTWELDQTEYVALSTLIANYQTIANLSSNLTASSTKYPSVNAVNTGLNLKLNLSGGTLSGDLALSYSIPTIQFSDTSSGTIWNVRNNGGGFEINSGITNKFTMLSSGNATFVNDLTANKFIKSGGTSAQFLMADGSVSSGNSGTVTSVGLSAPSGFSVSGSPVTSSGTLALGFAVGYSLPSDATQATWSSKQNALNGTGFVKIVGTTISYDNSTYYLASNPSGYISGITSLMVTNALGYTPYNATNPSGYISGNQTITLSGDVSGSGATAITTTLATITQGATGSFVKITLDTKGRVTGNVAVGSSDITSALGYTPYNSTNPSGYISGITSLMVTNALGYIPYNSSNPSGYISGITSGMVTTALGYTPVTNARQLTINGTTYDLSADRSWTISGTIGGLTSGFIPKATSASTLGNSLIYDNGTSVGINTISPGYALQVDGASTAGFVTSIVAKNPSTNAASAVKIGFDAGGTIWGEIGASYNSNNPYLGFYVRANSEKMRLTDAGNVGIGTTSPLALLNVVASGTKSTIAIGNTAASTYSQLLMYGGATKYNWSIGAQYNVNNALEITPSTATEGTTFSTPVVTILQSGNVGIGTTTPGYKLDVSGEVRANNLFRTTDGTNIGLFGSSVFASNVIGIGSSNNVPLVFGTNATERMRLDTAGNLGLGVTPSAWGTQNTVLQLLNNTSLISRSGFTALARNVYYTTSDVAAYISNDVATNYLQISGEHRWLNAVSGIAGATMTQTQAMTLDASGNLMVGTTTAGSKLHINGATSGIAIKTNHTAPYTFLYSYINNANGVGFDNLTGDLGVYINGAYRMYLNTSGNVLIGTTTDVGYKLDVSGQGRFNNAVILNRNSTSASSYFLLTTASSPDWFIGTNSIGTNLNNFYIYRYGIGNVLDLSASTGAATFSSSVTINTAIGLRINGSTESTLALNNTGGGTEWRFNSYTNSILYFQSGGGSTNAFYLTASGAGVFSSSATATAFYESSDKTIKTLLVDNYQTKGIESITAKLYTKNGKEELGYFAQDVQGILPSAVTMGTNGLLNLSYREVLVAKVQSLEQRVLELETQLNLR